MDPALWAGAAPCPAIVTIVMTGKVESGVDGLDGDALPAVQPGVPVRESGSLP